MSLFRLFSINSKLIVSLGCLSACTTASQAIYRNADVEPFRSVQTFVTPFDQFLTPIVGNGDPLSADPKKVFDQYCVDGKSRRSLTTVIRAVLPRLPKGVAIDAASEAQHEIYTYFRTVSKNFYLPSSYKETLATRGVYDSGFSYASKEPTLEALTKLAKEARSSEKYPMSILSISGSKTLLLAMLNLPIYGRVNYSGSEAGLFQWTQSNGKPPLMASIDLIFPSRPVYDKTGNKFYPLYPALPFEVAFFTQHFTMLIPKETQNQMFQRETFFIKSDESFDLGRAIEQRQRLWESFIESQTSLKEAQTDDPQIVDFNVTLDLNLFCRYGRAIKDLVTD